jgi:hypothetical protein
VAEFPGTDAELIKTNLSNEDEARLREAFADDWRLPGYRAADTSQCRIAKGSVESKGSGTWNLKGLKRMATAAA